MWIDKETFSIKELLLEYRDSLRSTRKKLSDIERRLKPLKQIYDNPEESESSRREARENAEIYINEKSVVASWERNLLYCIEWMETGKCPNNTRGIERRAVYDREIPFDPYWVQLRKDNNETDFLESLEDESMLLEQMEQKEQLVKSMTSCLSERQKEILQLSSNGYTHKEISLMLNVHKGTVSKTIARAKEKIEDEGWFMV